MCHMPLVDVFRVPVAMMLSACLMVTVLLVKTAWFLMLSSSICPRERRLPDFRAGKTRANLPVCVTWGRLSCLFAVDVIVALLGRWTVMGAMSWSWLDAGKDGCM